MARASQRADRRHFRSCQLKTVNVQILAQSIGIACAWDGNDAVLLNVPPKYDLRRGCPRAGRRPRYCGVGEQIAAARQWAIGRDRKAMFAACLNHARLVQQRVIFDLIAGKRRAGQSDDFFNLIDREV